MLKAIKEVTIFAKKDKEKSLETVHKLSDDKRKEKIKEYTENLVDLKARNEELNILITQLYENYALKKINEKHFNRLFKMYDEEQSEKEEKIKEYETEIENYHKSKVDTNKFYKMIERYTDFKVLTTPMLNEYIEKVVVHEAQGAKRGKDRTQQVDVYFNFIGNCDIKKA